MFDWLIFRRDGTELRFDWYVLASGRICLGGLLCTVVSTFMLRQFEPDGTMVVSSLWVMLLLVALLSMLFFLFGGVTLIAYGFRQLISGRWRG